MPKLSIRNLALKRSGATVLHDISLDVAEGELLVVIGPSGGGKSSLLRCLNRLNDIDSGAIELDGQLHLRHASDRAAPPGRHDVSEDGAL